MSRTPECIASQIAHLLAVKVQVPEFSLFGDENHAAIDAQAMVLREDCSAEEAALRCAADDKQGYVYVLDCAQVARRWLDGGREDGPAQDWGGSAP